AVIEAPASEQGPEEGRSSSAGAQTEQEALRDRPLFSATGGQMGESGLQAILSRQLDAFNQLVAKQLDAIGGSHAATNAGQSHVQRSRIAPATTDKLKQPHGVGKSVTASGAGTHLGETQKAHLLRLIEKYQEKT